MNTEKALSFTNEFWDNSVIPAIKKFISIPSISPAFDPKWKENKHLHEVVMLCKKWCESLKIDGLTAEVIELENRTPLLYIEIPSIDDDHRVLVYGHLDKQPVTQDWDADKDPWKGVIIDDKLYGRGSADNGYGLFSILTSVLTLRGQGLSHPSFSCVFECSEESDSPDISAYIDHLSKRIGQPDLITVLDASCGNYEQLWLTTSLRGMINGELTVKMLDEGVHSGDASGIVASPFRIARNIIERVEDGDTGTIKPDYLHTKIPNEREQEAQLAAQIIEQDVYTKFLFVDDACPISNDPLTLLLNKSWRPQLCVTGIDGLPKLENASNTIHPSASVKLSLRLPPNLDAGQACHRLTEQLVSQMPYNANIMFENVSSSSGWNTPKFAQWLNSSLDQSSHEFFGKPPVYFGEGGSIPLMSLLSSRFPKAQFVISGVLGPKSNAHGPNEFLHLPMVKKITACMSLVYFNLSQLNEDG